MGQTVSEIFEIEDGRRRRIMSVLSLGTVFHKSLSKSETPRSKSIFNVCAYV